MAWYRLLPPISAPVPAQYDRVAVVTAAEEHAATGGGTWQVLDPSEPSTVEIVRVTRLDETIPPSRDLAYRVSLSVPVRVCEVRATCL
ncbi:DUF6093 family protein [Streptomyces sp. TE33382]